MRILVFLPVLFALSNALLIPKLPALPALAGLAGVAVPTIIGGKLLMVPKIVFLKGAIGLAGLKIAGAHYLKKKILIPSAIAGAKAGYKASSAVLAAPQLLAAGKAAAVQGVFTNLPQQLPQVEVQAAPAAAAFKLPDIEHTFQVPVMPTPSLQWYQKPITLQLPRLVLQQPPSVHKTITIQNHVVEPPKPVVVSKPSSYAVPEPELPEVGYGAAPQHVVEEPVFYPQQASSYSPSELPEPSYGDTPH